MLDKYIDYRIDKLISDYEDNRITLINLKTQLESIDGWGGGQSGERVQSSPSGDGMDNLIIKRNRLQGAIDEYEKILDIYDRAWNTLNEREQFVLNQFYQKNQSKETACEMVRKKYFIERSQTHEVRKDALNHMKKLVFGE